jgi:predicted AlkP superfamily pyrophosphatase or phosphodiesterase
MPRDDYQPGTAIKLELLRSCFVLFIISCLLVAQPARKPGAHRLVVVSVAGLDERFLAEPASRLKIPNIRKLMRQGTVSAGVIGVAPSETFPSALAMVTGVPPSDEEGVRLWQAASAGGFKTAAVFWPSAGGAAADFDFPEPRESHPGEDVQFDDVAKRASPAGIVDRVEKASPGFQKSLWNDASALTAALYLLHAEKPDLLLVQFTDVDAEQRATRVLSVYAREILEDDDDRIGQITAAAGPDAVVAVVSGHGFENEDYIVRPHVLVKGPVDVEDGLIGTPDRAVAERLRVLMKDGHRHGLAREVPMTEVHAKARSITTWVAAFDTPAGCVAKPEDKGPAFGPGSHRGVSGLWPARPGYRSVFIAAGPGIPARRIGEIDLLQIAPTFAHIIGVELPRAKGKSVWQ